MINCIDDEANGEVLSKAGMKGVIFHLFQERTIEDLDPDEFILSSIS